MEHIRKKDSSFDPSICYSVVITSDWNKPLSEHPSIVNEPDIFEIADCDIPAHAEHMIYTNFI